MACIVISLARRASGQTRCTQDITAFQVSGRVTTGVKVCFVLTIFRGRDGNG
jgi:hypothetical protein